MPDGGPPVRQLKNNRRTIEEQPNLRWPLERGDVERPSGVQDPRRRGYMTGLGNNDRETGQMNVIVLGRILQEDREREIHATLHRRRLLAPVEAPDAPARPAPVARAFRPAQRPASTGAAAR